MVVMKTSVGVGSRSRFRFNNADGKGYFFVVNPRTGLAAEDSTGAAQPPAMPVWQQSALMFPIARMVLAMLFIPATCCLIWRWT